MMTIREILRRLDIAESMIRPHDGFAARLKRLKPDQRAAYDQWRMAHDKWATQFDQPDALYRASLYGDNGPRMPLSIQHALSGDPIHVYETDTLGDVIDKYHRALDR